MSTLRVSIEQYLADAGYFVKQAQLELERNNRIGFSQAVRTAIDNLNQATTRLIESYEPERK
jgi:hypothetical protein